MVKVNNIIETSGFLYDNKHQFVGEILTIVSLNDVCIQIKEQQLEGYYIMFNDSNDVEHKIDIDKDGRIYDKPQEFFGMTGYQLRQLF